MIIKKLRQAAIVRYVVILCILYISRAQSSQNEPDTPTIYDLNNEQECVFNLPIDTVKECLLANIIGTEEKNIPNYHLSIYNNTVQVLRLFRPLTDKAQKYYEQQINHTCYNLLNEITTLEQELIVLQEQIDIQAKEISDMQITESTTEDYSEYIIFMNNISVKEDNLNMYLVQRDRISEQLSIKCRLYNEQKSKWIYLIETIQMDMIEQGTSDILETVSNNDDIKYLFDQRFSWITEMVQIHLLYVLERDIEQPLNIGEILKEKFSYLPKELLKRYIVDFPAYNYSVSTEKNIKAVLTHFCNNYRKLIFFQESTVTNSDPTDIGNQNVIAAFVKTHKEIMADIQITQTVTHQTIIDTIILEGLLSNRKKDISVSETTFSDHILLKMLYYLYPKIDNNTRNAQANLYEAAKKVYPLMQDQTAIQKFKSLLEPITSFKTLIENTNTNTKTEYLLIHNIFSLDRLCPTDVFLKYNNLVVSFVEMVNPVSHTAIAANKASLNINLEFSIDSNNSVVNDLTVVNEIYNAKYIILYYCTYPLATIQEQSIEIREPHIYTAIKTIIKSNEAEAYAVITEILKTLKYYLKKDPNEVQLAPIRK
ncbi:hypothetical protein NEOKW01_0264 [Nematocida sp. AWRm80]|nr:hypothetical protein NEOKW01_0264 [Nematocida sp. AWRm80]